MHTPEARRKTAEGTQVRSSAQRDHGLRFLLHPWAWTRPTQPRDRRRPRSDPRHLPRGRACQKQRRPFFQLRQSGHHRAGPRPWHLSNTKGRDVIMPEKNVHFHVGEKRAQFVPETQKTLNNLARLSASSFDAVPQCSVESAERKVSHLRRVVLQPAHAHMALTCGAAIRGASLK